MDARGMTLKAIQQHFRNHIIADQEGLFDGVDATAEKGLRVYRHAYRAQLVGAMADTYEKTLAWLGEDAFEDAARRHIAQHPPSSWTLNVYGREFPATLRALYPNDPEIAELAWLDWSLRRAFDGPDATPIARDGLAQVDWDNAVLHFVPTLSICEVSTNCAAIWGALNDGRDPPAALLLPKPGAVRIWRDDLTPKYRSIEMFEHRALILAMAGSSFADLCALLVEKDDQDGAVRNMGAVLAAWLQDGLIAAVSARTD
jgi:hypothetical protein